MKNEHCAFEEKIAAANRSGRWSDELLAHVADCRACEEVALVSGYLCESSVAAGAEAALPNAGLVWSKAQAASNAADAIERALRPIVWARRFAFGVSAAAIVVAIALAWSRIGGFFAGFVESWQARAVSPSVGHNNVLLVVMAVFLLILVPVIFGVYTSWSED